MNFNPEPGPRKPRPPCRMFSELAGDLGMSQGALLRHRTLSAIPFPEPELRDPKANHAWYSPAKVHTWWAARQKEIHEAALPKL